MLGIYIERLVCGWIKIESFVEIVDINGVFKIFVCVIILWVRFGLLRCFVSWDMYERVYDNSMVNMLCVLDVCFCVGILLLGWFGVYDYCVV